MIVAVTVTHVARLRFGNEAVQVGKGALMLPDDDHVRGCTQIWVQIHARSTRARVIGVDA